jgi:acyl-coenzyme A thioesterase PaaI-like protein
VSEVRATFIDNDFCFACGAKNPLGLQLTFFRDGEAFCTRVLPKPHWQGFAGVMHGGIQSTIMDDLMSNHLFRLQRAWVATADLSLRYRRPVTLDHELLFISRVENHQGRIWLMTASCTLAAESQAPPLTTARGRFVEVPPPSV